MYSSDCGFPWDPFYKVEVVGVLCNETNFKILELEIPTNHFASKIRKTDRKVNLRNTKNTENDYLDQHLGCPAPKRRSKYTTDIRDRKQKHLVTSSTVGKREKWDENNIVETTVPNLNNNSIDYALWAEEIDCNRNITKHDINIIKKIPDVLNVEILSIIWF